MGNSHTVAQLNRFFHRVYEESKDPLIRKREEIKAKREKKAKTIAKKYSL